MTATRSTRHCSPPATRNCSTTITQRSMRRSRRIFPATSLRGSGRSPRPSSTNKIEKGSIPRIRKRNTPANDTPKQGTVRRYSCIQQKGPSPAGEDPFCKNRERNAAVRPRRAALGKHFVLSPRRKLKKRGGASRAVLCCLGKRKTQARVLTQAEYFSRFASRSRASAPLVRI